jgi:hypothetical protein
LVEVPVQCRFTFRQARNNEAMIRLQYLRQATGLLQSSYDRSKTHLMHLMPLTLPHNEVVINVGGGRSKGFVLRYTGYSSESFLQLTGTHYKYRNGKTRTSTTTSLFLYSLLYNTVPFWLFCLSKSSYDNHRRATSEVVRDCLIGRE